MPKLIYAALGVECGVGVKLTRYF